jgi:predicted amidohydrolase
MAVFQAAAIQLAATSDKAANLAAAGRLVAEAATGGAALVVLPEVFNWRGARHGETAAAEAIPGPTTDYCGELARRFRIHLVAGSMLESGPAPGKAFNTSCVFSPEGRLVGRYRKIHLFDVDLPGRVSVRESDTRAHGDEPVVVATDLGMIGLSICYDLRFPELYRRLVQRGATVITVPSAFTAPTGQAHWESLLRARAIENQVYVLAPNQYGDTLHGFADYGHTMVIGPWGEVLGCVTDGDAVVRADIDIDHVARVRREMPCLTHARLLC